ncbi:MAG: hypothetical protein EON93_17840 [Burkholderiales bacterium]|nr:MAG: hypothetical protein EON93_17840 [Burkholderiales bacterium]
MRLLIAVAALSGAFLLAGAPGAAHAQATRTWISGVGDDVNPCSRTAPCKTFAGAISKTAAAGEINCLDPGGFGAVTITKSITLSCPNISGGVLSPSTNGITINAAATDEIVIDGVDIQGGASGVNVNGIRFIGGGKLTVRNSRISGIGGIGISATSQHNSRVDIINTEIINSNGGGILAAPSGSATMNVTLHNVNSVHNLYGLRAEDRAKVTILGSNFSGNTNNGVVATGSEGVAINIDSSSMSNNGTNGILASGVPAANVRVVRSTITNNGTGLGITGGTITTTSPPTNLVIGNSTNGTFSATLNLQ